MKYAGLMQILRSEQVAIEEMYLSSLDEINKDIFANKCEIKLSTKGLFKFKFMINVYIYAMGIHAGVFPGDETEQDLLDYQKILSASAMWDARDDKKIVVPREIAIEVCEKENTLKTFMKSLNPKSSVETNKLFVDSLMLSLTSKSDDVYKYYLPKTQKILNQYLQTLRQLESEGIKL
jgi:hypothetical protein